MKKALVILHLFFAGIAFGQTEKGSIFFNFEGSLQHSSFQGNGSLIGCTNLELGYAFFDNFFLGVNYKPAYAIDIDRRSNLQISQYGLFSRYYFLKNKNRVYVQSDFLHQNGLFNGSNDKWNVGIGLNHFVSPNVAIEAHLNYNFYNRTILYWYDRSPVGNNEVYKTNENEPEGLSLAFGVRFFLSTNKEKESKEERQPLADRYLKRENRTIDVIGSLKKVNSNNDFFLNTSWSRFINNKLVFYHKYEGRGGFSAGNGFYNFSTYQAGLMPYMPIVGKFYFTPSMSVGPMLQYSSLYKKKRLGWIGEAQVNFTQFFKSCKVDFGAKIGVQDFFEIKRPYVYSLSAIISSDIFITESLAIKPIVYYNFLKDKPSVLNYLGNGNFVEFQDFRLQFGISYFY